jgi:hypothetical protein
VTRQKVGRRVGSCGLCMALLAGGLLLAPGQGAGQQEAAGPPPGQSAEVAPDEAMLQGTVRVDGGTRLDGVLPGALLEVRQGERTRTTVSDSDGRYRVEGLDAGEVHVTVFHLTAHRFHLSLHLPEGRTTSLDIELEARVLSLAPLVVEGVPSLHPIRRPGAEGREDRVTLQLQSLEASPGIVESGLIGALQAGPPEEDPARSGVLFMRGSTVDARTIYLDGAPVLTPFHVAGLVTPFEADVVDHAELFLGAAPSSYDGGLSYLLDVRTRTPRAERVRGSASLDGLVARATLDVPIPGGGGLLVGGRSLHGLQSQLEGVDDFPYEYDDLLLRWTLPLAPGHRLDYTGFFNREGVGLDEVILGGGNARWGNRVGSVRYSGRMGEVTVDAGVATSRYHSALPLEWDEPVLARGEAHQDRVSLDTWVPGEGWGLSVGFSADRADYTYRLDPRSRVMTTELTETPTGVGLEWLGGYAEFETRPWERIRLRGGLRAQRFSGPAGVRFGPRAAATLLLTESAELTASVGRYHQPLPLPGLVGEVPESDAATLSWEPSLPVASANHVVLTLDQELDEGLHLGVSGFVKGFDGLESAGMARMSASGTDLRISRVGDRVGGWVGYALSWFWEETPGQGSNRFTGRHLVSAGLQGRLTEGIEAGLRMGYGAGLPLSAVALTDVWASPEVTTGGGRDLSAPPIRTLATAGGGEAPLDLAREDDFLRLDLEVGWNLEPRIAGRTTHLRPYLQVLNALDRRDALFHYFDQWRDDELRPVAQRPFIPLLGVEWRF